MIIGEGLPFIKDYISAINEAIKQQSPKSALTRIQSCWLSFVILGLLVTNSLCWKRFERFSVGRYSIAGLSWMFCKARITWELVMLALKLLTDFMSFFTEVRVKAVAADAFYGTRDFMDEAAKITQQKQVISQIKKAQLINVNGKNMAVGEFFKTYQGKAERVILRGSEKTITYRSGRFKIKSHDKKYYVIALKYDDEQDYRYLIGSDSSWLDIDIIKAYSFGVKRLC